MPRQPPHKRQNKHREVEEEEEELPRDEDEYSDKDGEFPVFQGNTIRVDLFGFHRDVSSQRDVSISCRGFSKQRVVNKNPQIVLKHTEFS